MSKENLVEALEQIKLIVNDALGGGSARKSKITSRRGDSGHVQKKPATLPDHLIKMRDEGFFKQAKTYNEAHQKLSSTYPCDAARVRVALIRLHEAREFRKTSKAVGKHKQFAYVW